MRIFIILMVLGAIAYVGVRWAAAPSLRRHISGRLIASFAILIFAGMFASPVLCLVLCVLVMVTLTQGRLDAVCRYILLGALIPNATRPLSIAGTYLIHISVLDALSVGLMLAVMFKPDRPRVARVRGITVEDAVIGLLILTLNVAAVRWTEGVNGMARELLGAGLHLLLPYLLLRRHLRTIDEFRTMLGCLAAASAILSVYAVYEAANGWSLFSAINANFGDSLSHLRRHIVRGDTLRASVTMAGALMLGCYLSVGWIAMICSRGMMRGRTQWLAGCGLVSIGELAAQSRGSVICLALAATTLLIAYRRPGLAAAAMVGSACVGGLLFVAARFSGTIAGFLNLQSDQPAEGDYDYRQALLRRGLEEGARHRWTGTDMNFVLSQLEDIRQGQGIIDLVNTYLTIYLVSGLFGFVAVMFALIWMFRRMAGAFRRSDDVGAVAVRGFALASIIAILVQLSFMSFFDRIPMLLAIALTGTRLFVLTRRNARAGSNVRSARAPATARGGSRLPIAVARVRPAGRG